MPKLGLDFRQVDHLCLSHFHPDHVSDLVPFLFATNYTVDFIRSLPLKIIGPRGLKAFYAKLKEIFGTWIEAHTYPLTLQEVEEDAAVGSMPLELSQEAEKRLEEQAKVLGQRFCRGCDYCQPCPEEIPISTLMRVQSFIKRMGWERWKTSNSDAIEKYDKCQQCRQCEAKCPYELLILEIMADKVAWLREQYEQSTYSH